MKILRLASLLLFAAFAIAGAHAQSGCFANTTGSDITSVCVTTPGVDGGHDTITWTTGAARTSLVQVNASGGAPGSDPAFDLTYYNGSLVTSHSMSIPVAHMPATCAGAGAAACTCFTVSGSTSTTNYRSGDSSQTPGSPFGGPQQTNQFCYQSAQPSTGTFAATISLTGPAPTSGYPFQGHRSNIGVNVLWSSGAAPSYIAMTALTLDGNPCTMAVGGGICGTSGQGSGHITTQYVESNQEQISSSTNNYITQVFTPPACSSLPSGQCYYNGGPALGYRQSFISILPDTNALNLGAHTLCTTLQWLVISGGAYTAVGSPASACINFTVSAPTFTVSTPGSSPGVTAQALWNTHIADYITTLLAWATANATDPGNLLNDSGGPDLYTYNPWGFASYDPTRSTLGISDYLGAAATAWAANTGYTSKSIVLANGYWWSNSVASCTSASSGSGPSGSTLNAVVTDGSCSWKNYGTQLWWETQSQRIGHQQRDYELEFCKNTTWGEWSLFTGGQLMTCGRANSACAGSLEANAIACAGYPFWGIADSSYPQKTQYSSIASPGLETWRINAYAADDCIDDWYASGTKPVNGSVDECQIRIDTLLDAFMQITSCTPTAAISANWPCPANVLTYPVNFDLGFAAEPIMKDARAKKALLGVTDQADLFVLAKAANWINSNEYNQLGSDHAEPYSGFGVPDLAGNYNRNQTDLNPLTAELYAFVGAVTGNANLPTSGTPAFTVANDYLANTFNNIVGTGKEQSQWFKARQNTWQLLTGAWAWYQSDEQPANNAYVSTWPNKMEPYLQGSYPPPAAVCGASSCVFTTYFSGGSNGPAASTFIAWCGTSGCDPWSSGTIVSSGAGAVYDAAANQYVSTITASGLPSSTTGNWMWGACDALGNCGKSEANVATGNCCFTFTTTAPTLAITTTSPLPAGVVGTPYSVTLACGGGSGSYTWLQTFGGVPGLNLNTTTGVYSGTPTAPGSPDEVSFRCTDTSDNDTANASFNVTITGTSSARGSVVTTGNVFTSGNAVQ